MNGFSMEAVAGIIAVFSTISIGMISFGPIGRALAHRITHGRSRAPGEVVAEARVEELSGEVAALREQLDVTQERLDFAERLLAQARERGQLGVGGR